MAPRVSMGSLSGGDHQLRPEQVSWSSPEKSAQFGACNGGLGQGSPWVFKELKDITLACRPGLPEQPVPEQQERRVQGGAVCRGRRGGLPGAWEAVWPAVL